jgi:hypothetical protein
VVKEAIAAPGSATHAADEPPSGTRRRTRRLAWHASWTLLAFLALAVLLYFVSAHTVPGNSDGATVILEGQSMAAGHLLLHGWALSLDSFWTVDAVVYMFAVLIAGVHAAFLNLVPALIASAVIVTGVYLVRADWRGVPGFVGTATVVALLALPSFALAFFFLQGPLHVGTALLCLLAFIGLRNGRFGRGWVVAVVLLAAGCLGDLQAVALGVVPALAAGAVASARCRDWKAGLPQSAAAVASIAVALAVRELARVIGTFVLVSSAPRQPISQMINNLSVLRDYLPKMLGVGTGGFGSGGAPHFTEYAHFFGLIAVAAGVLVALIGLLVGALNGRDDATASSADWRLDDLLVFAFFGAIVVFLALAMPSDTPAARYLTAAVIFGSILAGRLLARATVLLHGSPAQFRQWGLRIASVVGIAVVGILAVGVGYNIANPKPFQRYDQVGAFLERHGLHDGVGDYWSASIVTVETNGNVAVRPVTLGANGRLVRYARETTTDWYAGHKFNFLVFNTLYPFGDVDIRTAIATFGRPSWHARIDHIEVLVWKKPHTVSPNGVS